MVEYTRFPLRKKKKLKRLIEQSTEQDSQVILPVSHAVQKIKISGKTFRKFQDDLRKALPGLVEEYDGGKKQ